MKQLNLIILGSPGAGKGTQADLISQEYNIPHISTGDMFRQILKENSPLAQKLKDYVEKGKLVPDHIVTEVVRQRLQNEDIEEGFIIDGFPRTKVQALDFGEILENKNRKLSLVIYLEASLNVILERLSGRRVCIHCGANYHIKNSPPKEEGICDKCGGELYQREDDKPETVRKRINIYLAQTEEILKYYREKNILYKVSGDLEKQDVFNKITSKIGKLE
jgi:adenylate kinase